jgi:hypothetical protein
MKIIAGLMSLGLSGCSFAAYGRPVVVPPPGGGDPSTTVGATVRCRSSAWPIGLDVTGAALTGVIGAAAAVTSSLLASLPDTEPEPETPPAVVWFLPAALYLSSAIYGGVRSARCRDAQVASARAKLRGEPLRLEGVVYETPASPEGAAGPRGNPPPGPPQSVAPLPVPRR